MKNQFIIFLVLNITHPYFRYNLHFRILLFGVFRMQLGQPIVCQYVLTPFVPHKSFLKVSRTWNCSKGNNKTKDNSYWTVPLHTLFSSGQHCWGEFPKLGHDSIMNKLLYCQEMLSINLLKMRKNTDIFTVEECTPNKMIYSKDRLAKWHQQKLIH